MRFAHFSICPRLSQSFRRERTFIFLLPLSGPCRKGFRSIGRSDTILHRDWRMPSRKLPNSAMTKSSSSGATVPACARLMSIAPLPNYDRERSSLARTIVAAAISSRFGCRIASCSAACGGNKNTDCAQLCGRCLPSEVFLLPVEHDIDSWADIRSFARGGHSLARLAAFLLAVLCASSITLVKFVDLALQRVRIRWQMPPPAFAS